MQFPDPNIIDRDSNGTAIIPGHTTRPVWELGEGPYHHPNITDIGDFCGACDHFQKGRCELGYGEARVQLGLETQLILVYLGGGNRNLMREVFETDNGFTDQDRYIVRGNCKSRIVDGSPEPNPFTANQNSDGKDV